MTIDEEMCVLTFCLILPILKCSLACDPKEFKAAPYFDDFFSFYIFAIDEMSPGSFNKTLFLEILDFTDTSRGLPIITSNMRPSDLMSSSANCELSEGVQLVTSFWRSFQNSSLSGILYGCQRNNGLRLVKVSIYGHSLYGSRTNNSCPSEIPLKYAQEMKNCFENMNKYVANCLRQKTKSLDIRLPLEIIFGIVVLSIAAYFVKNLIRFLVKTVKVSTSVESLRQHK